MKLLQGTGEDIITAADEAKSGDDSKSAWLIKLSYTIEKLLRSLPGSLQVLRRTSASITNPLFRFLEREVTVASQLLDIVKADLVLLKEMCSG